MKPLTLKPPYPSMESLAAEEIPRGPDWQYEPKWDGFRCLAFRDGDSIYLQSKSLRPLARFFPDVVQFLSELPARQFVLDGELLVPTEDGPSFEHLQLRLHPAASRVNMLAGANPAIYVVFDLLVDDDNSLLTDQPLNRRRDRLERLAESHGRDCDSLVLSPVARDRSQAERWLSQRGGGLDGIIAKRLDLPYQSGLRTGMQKIKNIRTADCVVGGYRKGTHGGIGSLLLGLYDREGILHHVGYTSSLDRHEQEKLSPLIARLEARRGPKGFTGRSPDQPSRWATEKTGQWNRLFPELVVEVAYDHFTGDRFRHGTRFIRRRPDKAARDCTFGQIPPAGRSMLAMLGRELARR